MKIRIIYKVSIHALLVEFDKEEKGLEEIKIVSIHALLVECDLMMR